jgi:hypothetical protein
MDKLIEETDKLMYIQKADNHLKYAMLFKEWFKKYGQKYKEL